MPASAGIAVWRPIECVLPLYLVMRRMLESIVRTNKSAVELFITLILLSDMWMRE